MASTSLKHFSFPHLLVGALMIGASAAALGLTQVRQLVPEGSVDLEKSIPREFAGWRELPSPYAQIDITPRDGDEATMDNPYDQTLMRTYVRGDGTAVMLALAWGRIQRQEVKIHRPELCYVAQGFELASKQPVQVGLGGQESVAAYRLTARSDSRMEPITYWIRIGDDIPMNAWQSRMSIFKEGLKGRVPDGMLVRVSQALPNGASLEDSYKKQADFLRDLYAALDAQGKKVLVGNLER